MHEIQPYKIVSFEEAPERKIELFQLVNACWNHAHAYYMKDKRHDRYASLAELEAEVKESKVFLLIDIQKNTLSGSIQFRTTYKKTQAYFGTLCIGKEYQGKGLAEKLITHVEAHAKKSGFSSLFILVVDCGEKLKEYYKKLGFKLTGDVVARGVDFLERVELAFRNKVHFVEMSKPLLLSRL